MAPKLFAHQLETYNDADLDRYIEENNRLVSVRDPENLSQQFIQRLRDRTHTSNEATSLPVDLTQVSARLLQLGAEHDEATPPSDCSQSPSESPSLPSPGAQRIKYLEMERECYDELVADGGRPWYQIHLLESVSKNPKEYRELLRFWQHGFSDTETDVWWCVFGNQVSRWSQFREWQGRMREQYENNFSKHTERSKKQLAKHSFTQPFEFDADPKRQDELTEWIEYMSYEYMEYDRYAWHKRSKRWYDQAWQKLVDSQVLRPNETAESVLSEECEWQDRSEWIKAEKAVESARSLVLSEQQALADTSDPSASAQRALAAAQSKLDLATQSLTSLERRNDLIRNFNNTTFNYRNAKRSAEHLDILLQWIRDQVPLIELKLKQAGVREGSVGNGGSSKVKRAPDCPHGEEHSTKEHNCDDEEPAFDLETGAAIGRTAHEQRRTREALTEAGSTSKRLKPKPSGPSTPDDQRFDDDSSVLDAGTAAPSCLKELGMSASLSKRRAGGQAEPTKFLKRNRGEDITDDQLRKRQRSGPTGTTSNYKASGGSTKLAGKSQRLSNSAANIGQGHDHTGSTPQQLRRSARIADRSDPVSHTSTPPRAAKNSGPSSSQKIAQAPKPSPSTGPRGTSRSINPSAKTAKSRPKRTSGGLESAKRPGMRKRRTPG